MKYVVGLVLSILITVNMAFADQQTQIRKTYLAAEKLVWHPGSTTYQQLYQQLHYYPLRPYLDQQRLLANLSIKKEAEIDAFLTQYAASPLDWRLRKKWLRYLAKKNQRALFIKYFRPNGDATLNCQYYRYKLALGADKKNIYPNVAKLWVKGRSQPKACDPLFRVWIDDGGLTHDLVWQRIVLAGNGGDHTLLRYLGSLLPKKEQYLAKRWKQVRANPAYVAKLDKFPKHSDKEKEIISYGLKRLIWRNQQQALSTYALANKTFHFSQAQQQAITYKFALALASKDHPQAGLWLKKVAEQDMDKQVIQWRLAHILRAQNWPEILAELESFPTSKQAALQWQYWYGRSLIETGQIKQGEAVLKPLSGKRHYYGFLAAARLKEAVNFQHQPIVITEQEKMKVMAVPAAKRALELFHLGRYRQARSEWNYWLSKINTRERLVASKIANEAKWYDRAIFSLSQEGYLHDVDLRFPLAYQEAITLYANKQQINPAWAFAITRRESSFMSDANSHVGAKGLMQLMPNTAKALRNKKVSTQYLLNPENNIGLGSQYLKQLLDRYKGNNVLATASYNAGPHRVSSWLKDKKVLPSDIWIETIPYKETREYVKSVLAYQQIYQAKIGQDEPLFEQLIATEIR